MSKKIGVIVLVIISIALGYLRSAFFGAINRQIKNITLGSQYQIHESLSFLSDLSLNNLVLLKWGLTVLFTIVFFCIIIGALFLVFNSAQGRKETLIFYVGFITLSAAAYGLGKLLNNTELGYIISRKLMGILQSPIFAMIIVPYFALSKKKANL